MPYGTGCSVSPKLGIISGYPFLPTQTGNMAHASSSLAECRALRDDINAIQDMVELNRSGISCISSVASALIAQIGQLFQILNQYQYQRLSSPSLVITSQSSLKKTTSQHNHNAGERRKQWSQGTNSGESDKTIPALMKAQLERGNVWESQLLSWLDQQNLLNQVISSKLDATDIQAIIEADERDHFFIAGLHFYPPVEVFKYEYARNGTLMPQFTIAKPDLLEIKRSEDGLIHWQIIDAKASLRTKTSHQFQIYFYHRCMEQILPTPRFVPMGTASVWLSGPVEAGVFIPSFDSAHIKAYPTSLLIPVFDNFLFHQLPSILAQDREQVKWHYNSLCRGCTFEHSCKTRATQYHELGAMANITVEDAEVLRIILELGRPVGLSNRLSDIEDLCLIVGSKRTVTNLRSSHPSALRRAQKILALSTKEPFKIQDSPVAAAALLGKVQVIQRRSYTLPNSEDIAVIISLVNDPFTLCPVTFCITVHTSPKFRSLPTALVGEISQLVSQLAAVLESIMKLQRTFVPPPRTQCYVFTPAERDELQKHLIKAALLSDVSDTSSQDRLKLCIGSLCEGAALLSTAFQPLILSGALLDFLSKKDKRTSVELRMCLERLGLPEHGTQDEMLSRIRAEITRLKAEGNRNTGSMDGAKGTGRAELGILPRVVVVKRELQQLLALPIPGYWDLPESFSALCVDLNKTTKCPTDEQIFADFTAQRKKSFERKIRLRNNCIYNVIDELRNRIASASTRVSEILVNEARVLASTFMDICKQDHLRKLFNMHQFEVLTKLTAMWHNRMLGCPDCPILEFRGSRYLPDGSYAATFSVKSGASELNFDEGRSFYNYILTEDVSSDYGDHKSIPIEAYFDDIAVFNVHFPLKEYMKPKWLSQPKTVQSHLLVVDIADIVPRGDETTLALRTYGDCNLQKGKAYRLSQRLVDFNLVKILSTLLELDLQVSSQSNNIELLPPFLRLCIDPRGFSQSMSLSKQVSASYTKSENKINQTLRELRSLDVETVGPLILKPSQRKAMRGILLNRLSVIWGPPGTGKTHTLSLSILRLLEVQSRLGGSTLQIILLTALTHAAIHACLDKLEYLMNCYRQTPNLHNEWLDNIIIEHVVNGTTHARPSFHGTYVYAGTVFQLYSFCKQFKLKSDCIVIDEAGQLGLGLASLVLRSLTQDGRVIVAGDNEQLAPIFSAEYPVLEPRLFESILDCIMQPLSHVGPSFEDESQVDTVVQLTENFRLNEDLGEFLSLVYKEKFEPQKTQTEEVAIGLQSLEAHTYRGLIEKSVSAYLVALSKAMLGVRQSILLPPKHGPVRTRDDGHRPISLSLLRMNIVKDRTTQTLSYEEHVNCEASLAATIVGLIKKAFPGETIFVATPHRLQRYVVNETLRSKSRSQSNSLVEEFEALSLSQSPSGPAASAKESLIRVDTIERLQGSEAAFVVCLFSYPQSVDRAAGVHFLLQRRRLNVAISRAQTLCIMITSDAVMNPGPEIFSNSESLKGHAFLKDFETRAWTGSIDVGLNTFS